MTAQEILARIPDVSVLVVGDVCLDRWCYYEPAATEPSRETGLPRLGVVRTEITPGAGGTVANNLSSLGVKKLAVLSAIGIDGFGWELIEALNQRQIATDLCVRSRDIGTFTYTKLINSATGVEDQGRVDFISMQPLSTSLEQSMVDNIRLFAPAFDVIVVSDQAETQQGGVVTTRVREELAQLAANHPNKIVWVDSRVRPEHFRNVILKPNEREAEEACARIGMAADYNALRKHAHAPVLIVTRGERGAEVITDSGTEWVPTRPVANPVDICGAGDSFTAGAVLALAVTGSPTSAARFGNLISAVTIMKKGTGTASPEEVLMADRAFA